MVNLAFCATLIIVVGIRYIIGNQSKSKKENFDPVKKDAHVREAFEKQNPNESKREFAKWVNQWRQFNNLDVPGERDQFFLEGKLLSSFAEASLSHAKNDLLVINPYIQKCNLSDALLDARKRGVQVRVISQKPGGRNAVEKSDREDYHRNLREEGVLLGYEKVHAKIIMVDYELAIISSMNFFANSAAGVTWEAGMVTNDPNTIKEVADALSGALRNNFNVANKMEK